MSTTSPPKGGFRRQEGAASLVGRFGCMAVLGLFLLFSVFCSGLMGLSIFAGTPAEFLFATFLATLTAVPYCILLLWLDRNEKEPTWLIITALLWGAAASTFISGIFNDAFGMMMQSAVGDAAVAGQLTASFSAPFIEELTKGFAVGALFFLFRKEFDNVLDGVLYGALIGLGFAWFENIIYYVRAGEFGGFFEMIKLAWLRGIVSGMGGSHAAYTGMTGLGFGLVRVLRKGVLRWSLIPVFWGMAMFAHFAWNTFAGLFVIGDSEAMTLLVGLPIATVVLQGPFLTLLFIVVAVVWRHENKIITTFLADEPADVATPVDVAALVPARKRVFAGLKRCLTKGPGAWWRHRGYELQLIELAFLKWHHAKDDETTWSADQDADVMALRKQLVGMRARL
ncbi:MAG: PrsW family intramembrane metalloprotease [Alphaproteobacteria bacterium]|nr:PrsW family intramembrane metalloprotease [Alphaproteobacteria bacterium]